MQKVEEAFRQNVTVVYRFAYANLLNKEQAEDVTSETFKRLLEFEKKHIGRVRNYKAWVLGTARNIIFETYRENKKTIRENDDMVKIKDPEVTIEEFAITEDQKKYALQLLTKLDVQTKEVIVLKVWEELSYSEISDITGLSVNAAKLRYSRGMKKLKEICEKDEKDGVTLRGVSIGGFVHAIAVIKSEAAFAPSPMFISSLSHTLFINISIMTAFKAKLIAFMAHKWFWPTVAACVIIAGASVTAGIIGYNSVQKSEERTETSSSTSSSETSTSSSSSTEVIEEIEEYSFVLRGPEDPANSPRTQSFTFKGPKDLIITDNTDSVPKQYISGPDFILNIIWPPEINANYQISDYEEIPSAMFDSLYRIKSSSVYSGTLYPQEGYNYVNNISLSADCGESLFQAKAPCSQGNAVQTADIVFIAQCMAEKESGIATCDELMESLTVVRKDEEVSYATTDRSFTLDTTPYYPATNPYQMKLTFKVGTNATVTDASAHPEPKVIINDQNYTLTITQPYEDLFAYKVVGYDQVGTFYTKPLYRVFLAYPDGSSFGGDPYFTTDVTTSGECTFAGHSVPAPCVTGLSTPIPNGDDPRSIIITCSDLIGDGSAQCVEVINSLKIEIIK